MNTQITVLSPSVAIHNGKAITTSQDVSSFFTKRHDDVLKKIRNLNCSPQFIARNFAVCYKNNELQNGKPQPYYEMTKDGFVFLVMGFTGKKAAQFKEAYILEFNRMESELHGNRLTSGVTQEERDAYNINALTKHYEAIYQIWKEELRPALKTLNSPIYGRLYDRFQDGYVFVKYLQQDLNGKLTNRQLPRHH